MKIPDHVEQFRVVFGPMRSSQGDPFGAFRIPCGSATLVCIATPGNTEIPWEHVSVRADTYHGQRICTWAEMCKVKEWFWDKEDCVVQFHPPESECVNHHPCVLHLWKPHADFPRPPKIAV